MKFQKRTYLLVLVFIAFGLVSCKNNLKEHNPSGLTAQAVYSTPKGFETLVNAAYSYQRWVYGKFEGELMTEMGTDLWMSGHDNPDHSMMNYNNLQGTDSKLEQLWKELYAGINVCNYGITNINKSGLSPNLQTTREAELRFLRAEYYWLLTETWGPVPFSLKPTRSIKTKTSRTPVDSIYAQIFKDLKYADANLPVTQSDYGRATKPAAEAMLARMYLTRGENKEAFDMATKVINNYNFKLLPNYANLWKMDNQQNSEVIYAVTYSDNKKLNDTKNPILYPYGSNRGGNNLPVDFVMWYFQQPGMQLSAKYGRPFQRFMPTLHLLNLYNGKIDSRYHDSFRTVWRANNPSTLPPGMAIGDTAIYATKNVIPDSVRKSKPYRIFDRNDVYNPDGSAKDQLHFVALKKFEDPKVANWRIYRTSRDFFVIRLAEMYLTAAEAQFKRGNLQSAAHYINVVRERAAKPGDKKAMMVSPNQLSLKFILNEWAREFAGEQMRWFVLKRDHKLVNYVKKYNPDAAKYVQPYDTLRPIPQSELDATTNSNFKQNPGYE